MVFKLVTKTHFLITCLFVTITGAAYRFYCSRKEDESARRRGKLEAKNRSKRKHERQVRVNYLFNDIMF